MPQRIGIFGGTFDPIHYGHLAAAVGALHRAGLDEIVFVPAGQPPHKLNRKLAAAQHRLNMVRLATAGNPCFTVSTVELDTPGPHYTVETLRLLSAAWPGNKLYFITGLDGLVDIQSWYAYRELLSGWPLLAVTRPGVRRAAWEQVRKSLGPNLTANVKILTLPGVAISSQELQDLVRSGFPITYLVPPHVEEYIEQHGLYHHDA